MRRAVIGIGSNSLRLLVADRMDGNLTAVLRDRSGLRVFASLDKQHEISSAMIRKACESVTRMKTTAEGLGARDVRLFATSAVRDAANRQAFTDALMQKTGLMIDILSGETEARLSFLGAAGEARAGMIDIGGGSTEIAIGEHGNIEFACSLQAGAVRLFRKLPIRSVEDARQAMGAVRALLIPYLDPIGQLKTPAAWVGVGGTMTAAATVIQNIPWDSSVGIHGFSAGMEAVKRATDTLADMAPQRRRGIASVPPDRADIIVHGLAILLACMETLQIKEIKISENTNLDGYLLMITAGESGSAG